MAKAKTKAPAEPRERYFIDGDRFWACTLDSKAVRTRSGKVGKPGQVRIKEHDADWAARSHLIDQVRKKIREGFVEQLSETPPPAPKQNAALEKAILADPTDDAAYSVYADWLLGQDDPRGELIALQAAGKHEAANKLLATHAESLLGVLALHQQCYDGFHEKAHPPAFTWKNGFIYAARLAHNMHADPRWKGKLATDVLVPLLRHPSGRFLVELTINENDDPSDDELDDLYEVIAEYGMPTLRKLRIGDDISQLSWYRAGKLGPLWKALPNLRHFQIESGEFQLGTIEAPNLVFAKFETGGLSRACAKSIANAKWPALEHLEVFVGNPTYGASTKLADLLPILEREDMPELRYLGLKNAEFQRDLIEPLAKSKLVKQLHTLDMSCGILVDDDVPTLLAHADAFRHLEVLDLGSTWLSDAAVKKLEGVAKKIVAEDRWPDDGEYRYVRVGE